MEKTLYIFKISFMARDGTGPYPFTVAAYTADAALRLASGLLTEKRRSMTTQAGLGDHRVVTMRESHPIDAVET